SGRNVEHVVPQVVDGAGPGAPAARAKVRGLMAEPSEKTPDTVNETTQTDDQPPTQATTGSALRPQSTQALFRPDFDDDDDDFPITVGTRDTEPQDRMLTATRVLQPVRHLGGGLVEIPRVSDIDPVKALMT